MTEHRVIGERVPVDLWVPHWFGLQFHHPSVGHHVCCRLFVWPGFDKRFRKESANFYPCRRFEPSTTCAMRETSLVEDILTNTTRSRWPSPPLSGCRHG